MGKLKIIDKKAEPKTPSSLYDEFLFVLNLILNKRYRGCPKSRKAFQLRIKEGFTLQDFKDAINNASMDSHHIDSGFKWLTAEFICRADKLDRFMQTVTVPQTAAQQTNFDHFNNISKTIDDRINSIPNEAYEQFKQTYVPGL